MKRKRRNHSPKLKAKVALEAIRGEKTLAQLAQQYDVHPNQIVDWKQRVVEGMEGLFEKPGTRESSAESQIEELHAKIGELVMERDFLSNALGRGR
jgi:transposase-like protein